MSSFLTSPKVIQAIATSNNLEYEEVVSLASIGFDNLVKTFKMDFTDQVIDLMDESISWANNLKMSNADNSWVVPFSECPPIVKMAKLFETLDTAAFHMEEPGQRTDIETFLPNWKARVSNEMRKTRNHSLPLFIYNMGVEYERKNETLPGNLTIVELVSDMLPFYNCQVWGGLFLKEERKEFSYEFWKYLYDAFYSLR